MNIKTFCLSPCTVLSFALTDSSYCINCIFPPETQTLEAAVDCIHNSIDARRNIYTAIVADFVDWLAFRKEDKNRVFLPYEAQLLKFNEGIDENTLSFFIRHFAEYRNDSDGLKRFFDRIADELGTSIKMDEFEKQALLENLADLVELFADNDSGVQLARYLNAIRSNAIKEGRTPFEELSRLANEVTQKESEICKNIVSVFAKRL